MATRVISAVLTLKDRNFSSGVKDASGKLTDYGRKVQQTANEVDRFADRASAAFATVAKGAAGLAATGIGALAGAAAATYMEMDSAFNLLEARTGATGAELAKMESSVKEVFKSGYGESIEQVANDMAVLKQNLGEVDAKTLESTQILGRLSENADVDSVARALRSMTASFPGATQQQSLDLITKTLQVGGDASGDLLDTFNEYSGVVSALGVDMDTFANILVNGAKAGARNYDVVADTLKEFNIRAKDGSKTTVEGFEAIGLNAAEMGAAIAEGGAKGEAALYKTFEALGKIEDPVKRNEAGVALMGTKFEDLEWQTVQALGTGIDMLGEYEGATERAGEAIEKGFGMRMSTVWRNIKVGAAEAFQDAGGAELLDGLATAAENLVPIFTNIVSKTVEVATSIRDNWSSITPVISALAPVVGGVAAAFVAYRVGVVAVTAAQTIWRGVTTATTVATALLNGTLRMSPLGWVATLIGLVVTAGIALYQNWDTVKAVAQTLWDKTKEVFGNIYNWASEKIQGVTGFFRGLVNTVKDFITRITSFKMPAWVTTAGEKIGAAVSKLSGSHATGLNRVPYDGYIAELHKDEMIIPARQAEKIREQGGDIHNVDKLGRVRNETNTTHSVSTSSVTNHNKAAPTVIIQNLNAKGITANEVLNELIPQLKLKLQNM